MIRATVAENNQAKCHRRGARKSLGSRDRRLLLAFGAFDEN